MKRLVAVHAGLGDLRETCLPTGAAACSRHRIVDDDAELFLFGQVNHAISHGSWNSFGRFEQMSSTLKLAAVKSSAFVQRVCTGVDAAAN